MTSNAGVPATSAASSSALPISTIERTGPAGWLSPLTMLPTLIPAAAAFTSMPGSSGGSNNGSC